VSRIAKSRRPVVSQHVGVAHVVVSVAIRFLEEALGVVGQKIKEHNTTNAAQPGTSRGLEDKLK
jgi:hypothetical protein